VGYIREFKVYNAGSCLWITFLFDAFGEMGRSCELKDIREITIPSQEETEAIIRKYYDKGEIK
jgi:hypothetical protein